MQLPTIVRRILGMPAPRTAPPEATRASADPRDGFSRAPHTRRSPLGWRIAVGLAVGLIFLSGLIQVIVRPIVNAVSTDPPPPAPVETIDAAAAAAIAAGFTADYWSYDADAPSVRADALSRWTRQGASIGTLDGTGQLRADVVTPGQIVTSGADVAVVQTTARVTPASRAEGAEPRTYVAPEENPVPRAADPGPATGAWQPGAPRWLTLDVVVTDTGSGLAVTGATLSGDQPAAIVAPSGETDTRLTGQTSTGGLPEDVFAAYAEGDRGQLSYLTAPSVQLDGLSSVVELAGVTGWSMATDRADTPTRYASADVTWELADTQFQLRQSYALTLTDTDGRWLLGSIGPRIEETP